MTEKKRSYVAEIICILLLGSFWYFFVPFWVALIGHAIFALLYIGLLVMFGRGSVIEMFVAVLFLSMLGLTLYAGWAKKHKRSGAAMPAAIVSVDIQRSKRPQE